MASPYPAFCTTPGCGKKLAECVQGYAVFTCPRCKQRTEISNPIPDGMGGYFVVDASGVRHETPLSTMQASVGTWR